MKWLSVCLLLLPAALLADEFNGAMRSTDSRQCQTRLYFEHDVSGGRCFFNEVMTGIRRVDPLVIRCAKLEVTCAKEEILVPQPRGG